MRISRPPAFAFLLFLALACNRPAHITQIGYGYTQLSAPASDSATAAIIAPYKEKHDREMNEIIGRTDKAMPKERDQLETLLGNFVADVCLEKANALVSRADMCVLNNGGLRSSLPKGEISRGKIFELMPFENEIVVLTLSGEKMQALLNYIAAAGGVPVAGIKMGVKGRAPGKALIQGQPFDPQKNYRVATSDYLANGGDRMSFFAAPIAIEYTGSKIRDALIEHFKVQTKKGATVTSSLDGRLHHETE